MNKNRIDQTRENETIRHLLRSVGVDIEVYENDITNDDNPRYCRIVIRDLRNGYSDDAPELFRYEGGYLDVLSETSKYLSTDVCRIGKKVQSEKSNNDFAAGYRAAIALLDEGIDPTRLHPKP